MDSLRDFISEKWRAGFELEVVLGSLGEAQFEKYEDDAMDEASPVYCRAVARALSEITGQRWSVPRGQPKRLGYYVVPEYDIDPLHFPKGVVAGVELITPPLALDEAETLRLRMVKAIEELEGWFNFERNDYTIDFGWHINIDAGKDCDLAIFRYAAAVDELAMLRTSGRSSRKYTSLQRHAFGIPLLRELHAIDGADRIAQNFENFITHNAGLGKAFAANFERKHYVELRHFGVLDFSGAVPLATLIWPVLAALQMDHESLRLATDALIKKFQFLNGWLTDIRPLLGYELDPPSTIFVGRSGSVVLDGEPAGSIFWNGTAKLDLRADADYALACAIHNQLLADVPEAVALMALDVAESRLADCNQEVMHAGMSARIDDLAKRLDAAGLAAPVKIASGSWWAKK